MGVERKKIKTNESGKVVSINRNEKQDYENKVAGALMKAWNVKIEGADEEYVYHSKGKDSDPIMSVGETINYDLTDVISTKGHWYYQISVKQDFSKKKYVNPDLNKKRVKALVFNLIDLTIIYFSEIPNKDNTGKVIENKEDFTFKNYMVSYDAIYKFITGYDSSDKTHKNENDYYYMELRAKAYEYTLINNYIFGKMDELSKVINNAKTLLAEVEAI